MTKQRPNTVTLTFVICCFYAMTKARQYCVWLIVRRFSWCYQWKLEKKNMVWYEITNTDEVSADITAFELICVLRKESYGGRKHRRWADHQSICWATTVEVNLKLSAVPLSFLVFSTFTAVSGSNVFGASVSSQFCINDLSLGFKFNLSLIQEWLVSSLLKSVHGLILAFL